MSNAPAVFQRMMDQIFTPLKHMYPRCIFIYMDNILITTGDDIQFHEQIVNTVLGLLTQEDFYLKLSRCLFHQTSIDYLGIRIEGGWIKIDPTKINGLAEWCEVLTNIHEVCSTLGTFGYNHPFVPGYASIMQPINALTKKGVVFVWTPDCTNAIRKLKEIVRGNPVLMRPDHTKPFILEVDASQYTLGAVLSQKNEKGRNQPVGYFSKTLIPAECNYNIYDRELLALVRSLQH